MIVKPSRPQIQSEIRFDGQLFSGKFSARTDFSQPRSDHVNSPAGPTTNTANYLEATLGFGRLGLNGRTNA